MFYFPHSWCDLTLQNTTPSKGLSFDFVSLSLGMCFYYGKDIFTAVNYICLFKFRQTDQSLKTTDRVILLPYARIINSSYVNFKVVLDILYLNNY